MPNLAPAAATPLELAGNNLVLVYAVLAIAVIALVFGLFFRRQVLATDPGTENMQTIGAAVEEGAQAYLNRQFRTLSIFVVLVFGLLFLLPADTMSVKLGRSMFFVVGAVFSALIGYLGMSLAVKANVRVASAARDGNRDYGMRIAFRTGGTVGMATVGLGLLGAAIVVLVYKGDAPKVLEGFGFGAALLAMFMRVGGGIFTKAADVGADLVGKVEAGIPEDDPRNAATIADNVGDNVGDCAGMAADLFESYAVTLVAALILGSVALAPGTQGLVFPLIIPAIGAITAIIGVFITRVKPGQNALSAINQGFYISAVISAVLSVVAVFLYLPTAVPRDRGCRHRRAAVAGDRRAAHPRRVAVILGIVLAAIILWLTGHFTGTDKRPDARRRPHLAHRRGHRDPRRHRRRVRVGGLHRGHHRRGGLRRVPARWRLGRAGAVLRGGRRYRPAHHGRRHRRDGHLRAGLRQRSGHRRDVRRHRRRGRADPHRPRRRRQHHQGDHQGHRHRHRGAGGHRAVRFVHRRVELHGPEPAQHEPDHRGAEPVRAGHVQHPDRHAEHARRPAPGCRGGVPLLRPGDQRGHPRRRRHRLRGASPVPRAPRDHGLHREARVRPRGRHLHP